MGEDVPETVMIADDFRFAGADSVDVAVTVTVFIIDVVHGFKASCFHRHNLH